MLLGILDNGMSELLSVNNNTVEPWQESRQINDQSMQGKPCVNKNLKDNVTVNGKCKYNIDYSLQDGTKRQIQKQVLK